MHWVCRCSLLVWKRSFLKKGTPRDLILPRPGSPLGGSGQKTTTLVRHLEYFMHTKFHQNPSSGSGEEDENVKVYGRRTTIDGRTDDGRCAMTIAHLSLRLRWAKKDLWYTCKFKSLSSWNGPDCLATEGINLLFRSFWGFSCNTIFNNPLHSASTWLIVPFLWLLYGICYISTIYLCRYGIQWYNVCLKIIQPQTRYLLSI